MKLTPGIERAEKDKSTEDKRLELKELKVARIHL